MASYPTRPTKLELSILRVLWKQGAGTAREIHAITNESKPSAPTTILKILQIMTAKQLVVRDDSSRPQIYRARYSKAQTQSMLIRDLIQHAFEGSVEDLVSLALSTRKRCPKTAKTPTDNVMPTDAV